MAMYAKVFEQIFDSSISEDHVVRHVFMDLLVLSNQHGEVDMTLSAIARRTNVPLKIVTHAVKVLCSPDESSRTQEEDGRRLTLLDDHREWGWKIVNFEKYNAMRNEEARREYFKQYKRKVRAKAREINELSTLCTTMSTPVHHESTVSTHVDVPVTVLKPSRVKREVKRNPLYEELKSLIFRYFSKKNDVEPEWNGAEGKQLSMLLQANPNAPMDHWKKCLTNRFNSEVSHSERPSLWLNRLSSFAAGPLDKYGKPKMANAPRIIFQNPKDHVDA